MFLTLPLKEMLSITQKEEEPGEEGGIGQPNAPTAPAELTKKSPPGVAEKQKGCR